MSRRTIRRRQLIAGALVVASGAVAAGALRPGPNASAASTQLAPAGAAGSGTASLSAAAVRTPGAWVLASGLQTARSFPSVIPLYTGLILVTGGLDVLGNPVPSSEIVDPLTGQSSVTGAEAVPRKSANTVRLYNGKVLRVGGLDMLNNTLSSAELYDPASGTWSSTGSLHVGRWGANLVSLRDGTVLIFSGQSGHPGTSTLLASAEIYDPATGLWTATANLMTGMRNEPSAILLNATGKLLVFGGGSTTAIPSPPLGTAELFDPESKTWTATASLNTARTGYTFDQLATGAKIVVAGGTNTGGTVLNTAEVYDSIAGTWSFTGTTMTQARTLHQAFPVAANGKLLVVGGLTGAGISTATNTAELYDPVNNSWSATGPMLVARAGQVNVGGFFIANLTGRGELFVYGGVDGTGAPVADSELYDPAAGTWSATGNQVIPRVSSGQATLPDQTILRIGGKDAGGNVLASIEIYAEQLVAPSGWSPTGAMTGARSNHGQILLASGKTLVAGGSANSTSLMTAELYDEGAGTWSATGPLGVARTTFTLTRLPNGAVLAAGGAATGGAALNSAEIYSPTAGTWTPAMSMSTARSGHRAVLLLFNGMVLVAGGGTSAAELYNWVTNTWSPASTMSAARTEPSIVALNLGKILVAGGTDNSGHALASVDLYNPVTNTWSATGNLNVARSQARAASLSNGKVAIAGGFDASGHALASIEVYDPIAGTWAIGGNFTAARGAPTLTPLPNAEFLAAGGLAPTALALAELFDDSGNLTFATTSMSTARGNHGAVDLPNGKILVAGGTGTTGASLASAELYQEGYAYLNRVALPVVMN